MGKVTDLCHQLEQLREAAQGVLDSMQAPDGLTMPPTLASVDKLRAALGPFKKEK